MTGEFIILVVVPKTVQVMVSRILGRMEELFTTTESPGELQGAESDESQSIDLYTCDDCKTTYIKNDMQSCPECGEAVDPTPSFAELDIGPDGGK